MSKLIRHETCPKCGSRDNLAIYDDHEYCFGSGCGYQKQYALTSNASHKDNDNKGGSAITKDKAKSSGKAAKLHPVPLKSMPALKERLAGS
jgi:Zn ribbon nucleic-acid-binding protein